MSFLLRRSLPVRTSTLRAFSTTTASRSSSFAKMTIVGRLADTPEVTATSTGREIVQYAVATNSGPKDNQKSNFFKITAFIEDGPLRNFITSLEKGSLVHVEGDATINTYQDSEGKNQSRLNIVQRRFDFLARKQGAKPEEEP